MAADAGPLACPGCGGAVRPGAPWCTQCFADLRASARVPSQVPAAPVAAAPVPSRPDVVSGPAAGHWPCTTCGASVPFALDACPECGASFLAELRAVEPPLLVLPGVGDLTRLSRGQRLGVASGAVLAVLVVVLLLGLLLG